MQPLIVLLSSACGLLGGGAQQPAELDAEPTLPEPETPRIKCPENTTFETSSTVKGTELWCDRDGIMHGPYVRYYPNENKAASGGYDRNQYHGSWMWWHESGETKSKGQYSHGKKTGAWTLWHGNGNRKEEGDYLQDRRQGNWTTFYETGSKESEGMYQNDMRNGTWRFFNDDDGNTLAKTERYENDEMVEEKIIDDKRDQ